MGYNEYHDWYVNKNYDRLTAILPRGSLELIKKQASSEGLTISEFIRKLLPDELIAERTYVNRRNTQDDAGNEDSGICD